MRDMQVIVRRQDPRALRLVACHEHGTTFQGFLPRASPRWQATRLDHLGIKQLRTSAESVMLGAAVVSCWLPGGSRDEEMPRLEEIQFQWPPVRGWRKR